MIIEEIYISGAGTWVCPPNVTTITLELWGAGGNGGNSGGQATGSGGAGNCNHSPGGGGAGGTYIKVNNFSVTPGNSYSYYVGTSSNKATTWGTTIRASGGKNGNNGTASAPGQPGVGEFSSSIGYDVIYYGGNGAPVWTPGALGGGGGGSGFTYANGNTAFQRNFGSGTGNGGMGGTCQAPINGAPGEQPGGGGGGASNGDSTPGVGGLGKITITYDTIEIINNTSFLPFF